MEDFLGMEFETGGDVPGARGSGTVSSTGLGAGIGNGTGTGTATGSRRASFDRVTAADILGRQRHDSLGGGNVGLIGGGSGTSGFAPSVFDFSSTADDSLFGLLGQDTLQKPSPKRINFTAPGPSLGDQPFTQSTGGLTTRIPSLNGFGSSTDFGNPGEGTGMYDSSLSRGGGADAIGGAAQLAAAGAGGREAFGFIGAYTPAERRERIARFIEKRSRRVWTKKVKYDVRKNFADSRIRVKGRFVKKEDEEVLRELMSL